jgi:C-terminal processing protease CtpA/Prc
MQPKTLLRLASLGLGGLLLGVLLLTAILQRARIAQLSAELERQQATNREMDQKRAEVQGSQTTPGPDAEIQLLRDENKELPRLRNEVRQLRERQQEAEALRAANARLLQALQGASLSSNQQAAVAAARRDGALLGIAIRSANDPQNPTAAPSKYNGAVATWIDPNAPVASSGLKVGDIIIRADGRLIENAGQLQSEMLARKPGDTVTLDVMRDEELLRIPVKTRYWTQ